MIVIRQNYIGKIKTCWVSGYRKTDIILYYYHKLLYINNHVPFVSSLNPSYDDSDNIKSVVGIEGRGACAESCSSTKQNRGRYVCEALKGQGLL
jgi:hypothetical protein